MHCHLGTCGCLETSVPGALLVGAFICFLTNCRRSPAARTLAPPPHQAGHCLPQSKKRELRAVRSISFFVPFLSHERGGLPKSRTTLTCLSVPFLPTAQRLRCAGTPHRLSLGRPARLTGTPPPLCRRAVPVAITTTNVFSPWLQSSRLAPSAASWGGGALAPGEFARPPCFLATVPHR